MNFYRNTLQLARWACVFALMTTVKTDCHARETENASGATQAVEALVGRLLADTYCVHAQGWFEFDHQPAEQDFFSVDTTPEGKVRISGNNGVSLASGVRWYLAEVCGCHFSLHDNRIDLPAEAPQLDSPHRADTPFRQRNFFNYCTFGYTMPWWDWPRWEKMIDYMALHGINMPLAITGQEAVWQAVYRDLGFSDAQLAEFFVGPAHLPWGWMGNIDGLAGPLPQSWIDSHRELQVKILQRQRSLGMRPLLQAFTGHVPPSLRVVFPEAKVHQTTDWAGLPGTWILDPTDPLFQTIGTAFLKKQTEMYGTDHLYDADVFNEVNPQTNDLDFIASVGDSIYRSMSAVDPQATWVYQGWFLHWQRDFWKEPQARALFSQVPLKRSLGLDLMCESAPVWERTDGFYGKPWVWNVICDKGQKVNLSGDLQAMQSNLQKAMADPRGEKLVGLGIMMEGFGYNPVVQTFVLDRIWAPESVELTEWIERYATRRYGQKLPAVSAAWRSMVRSGPYSRNIKGASPLEYTPGLSDEPPAVFVFPERYDDTEFSRALGQFLSASEQLSQKELYRFDVVNFTREYLFNVARYLLHDCSIAAKNRDIEAFQSTSNRLLELIQDIDVLLASDERFLLGKWISDARRWGTTASEKDYLAYNAKTIVTVWQPVENSGLRDYASKHWHGLVGDFYHHRWKTYLQKRLKALGAEEPFQREQWLKELKAWELEWIRQHQDFPSTPEGNSLNIAAELYAKYQSIYQEGNQAEH